MNKYSMNGSKFRVDIGAGLVAVPGCESIGFPEEIVGEIPAGDHDSDNEVYISDISEIEQFDVVMRWDPAEATHAFFEANKGSDMAYDITVKGAAEPLTNDVYTGSATILSYKKAPHAYKGGLMMATLTLRAHQKPAITSSS